MLIEVLGLPNGQTASLEAALAEALSRLGLEHATVRRIEDMGAMIARGVRKPPALRVGGRVVCRKCAPSAEELVALLEPVVVERPGGDGAPAPAPRRTPTR